MTRGYVPRNDETEAHDDRKKRLAVTKQREIFATFYHLERREVCH